MVTRLALFRQKLTNPQTVDHGHQDDARHRRQGVRRRGARGDAGVQPRPGCRVSRTGTCNLIAVKLLVTGGAGFIGSNHVRWLMANTDDEVTVYDALTYAGNRSTLRAVEEAEPNRFRFVHANVCDLATLSRSVQGHDAVV